MILSIDPGSKVVGYSFFLDNLLVGCGLLRAKNLSEMSWTAHETFAGIQRPIDVVIECPQSHAQRVHQKGPQQDLITIALVGGVVAAAASPRSIRSVLPREWKGQVDANVMLQRIMKRLLSQEAALVNAVKPASLLHNCQDAVGIGLWAVGRL